MYCENSRICLHIRKTRVFEILQNILTHLSDAAAAAEAGRLSIFGF